jgi:methyl-accepting chemotaxis protein
MQVHRIRLKTLIPISILLLIVIGGGALAYSSVFANEKLRSAFDMLEDQRETSQNVERLALLQQKIETGVISVQESLTDVSATRGLDGMDDGPKLAAETAVVLKQRTAAVKELAGKIGARDLADRITALEQQFDVYYDLGVKMAQAYVAEGPAGGNKLMGSFDAQSDKLQEEMEACQKILERLAEERDAANDARKTRLLADTASLDRIALIAGGLLIATGAAIAAFLIIRVVRPLTALSGGMVAMAAGDLRIDIPGAARADEVGDMARAVQVFRQSGLDRIAMQEEAARIQQDLESQRLERERHKSEEALRLQTVVETLAAGLGRLAECNIRMTIDQPFSEEFERLRHDFNNSIETLQETLEQVMARTTRLTASSEEMREASANLAKRTEQQAAALEETSSSLEEIATTVRASVERTQEVRSLVRDAKTCTDASGVVVGSAVEAMKRIEGASSEIGQIIDVIDQIAFQTNLLALNAGVEAARAGDAGKGFAVVAQEVRELAQRSAKAAKEITQLIANSSTEVADGVRLVGETGAALHKIQQFVVSIDGKVEAIATASHEQATGLSEISRAVNALDQLTQSNAAMVEETTAIGHAQQLSELIGRFQLSARSIASGPARRSGYAYAA